VVNKEALGSSRNCRLRDRGGEVWTPAARRQRKLSCSGQWRGVDEILARVQRERGHNGLEVALRYDVIRRLGCLLFSRERAQASTEVVKGQADRVTREGPLVRLKDFDGHM
jgi:hypothetical protein